MSSSSPPWRPDESPAQRTAGVTATASVTDNSAEVEGPATEAVLGRVRRRGWVSDTRGVHRPAGVSPLRAWQLVLPDSGRFTHLTAAEVHGLWLPPVPDGAPVLAAVSSSVCPPSRAGLRVARHRDLADPMVVHGLRVDPVSDTVLACARDLAPLDLVVLVDSALHLGCPQALLEEVASRRRRGAPALRAALRRSDPRSESPFETLLRLLHEDLDVEVEPQREFYDEHGFVARGDLWVVGTDAVHEYDGAHHLDRHQQAEDLRRVRRMANMGLDRRGYTRDDVLTRAVTILRDADHALGRPHDPSRARRWHEELAESAFTSRGRSLLWSRLSANRGE